MDDAGIGALPHFVGEDRGGILLGVARMDDDRQLRFACRRKMRAETRLLTCAIRMIVIIIEPAFAAPDHARLLPPPAPPGGIAMTMLGCLVRMCDHPPPAPPK